MTEHAFRPDQRPDVEVLRDGVWYQGELRDWQQREGGWWANVQWRKAPGQTYLDTVPASDVRQDGRDEFGIPTGPHRATCGCELEGRALLRPCDEHLPSMTDLAHIRARDTPA